jgi:hypothetical protein
MNTDDRNLPAAVSTLRIIVLALAGGVLIFAGVVLFLRSQGRPGDPNMQLITWLGIGLLVSNLAMAAVLLPMIDASNRRRLAAGPNAPAAWVGLYVTRTIIGCALVEGAAFMCLVGALLDGQPWGLLAGAAGAALMLGLYWPTEDRAREFVERQRELAAGERMGV